MLSSQTHRRPGLHAPAYVVQRLKRFHPNVSLAWDCAEECWVLVAHDAFNAHTVIHHLKTFRGPSVGGRPGKPGKALVPTLENTVWWLDKHDSRRFENDADVRRWLDDVDAQGPHDELAANEAAAKAKIEEGTDRLWRATGKRIPLAMKPSDDHAVDSASSGDSGPAADL